MAATIAADLLSRLRLPCLDQSLADTEPKTLRYQILHTAVRLVRGQRKHPPPTRRTHRPVEPAPTRRDPSGRHRRAPPKTKIKNGGEDHRSHSEGTLHEPSE